MIRPVRCLAAILGLATATAEPAAPAAKDTPAAAPEPATEPAAKSPAPDAPAETPQPTQPAVIPLDASRFRIGEVEFNKETRAITFPAAVNMSKGLLEYVIVHENGKVHESLLRTKIDPTHLNVALKLLRYQPSPELFPVRDEDGKFTGSMPVTDPKIKAAARVAIRVHWKTGDDDHSAEINDWVLDTGTNKPMPPGPWVYGGSVIYEGRFLAAETGDIAAILTNEISLFNYPGKDKENDEVWVARTKVVPPDGTPVTVEIRPWQTPAPPKP